MSELDYLDGQAAKGAISRREFMGRAAALGASSARDLDHARRASTPCAAETPKNGGLLRLGLGGGSTTDSIDVGSYNNSVMIDVGHGLFNGARRMGRGRQAESRTGRRAASRRTAPTTGCSICARASSSPNGQEFDADDAIYSLNLHRGDTKSGGGRRDEGGHRRQEARQIPDPDHARRRRRRFALRR